MADKYDDGLHSKTGYFERIMLSNWQFSQAEFGYIKFGPFYMRSQLSTQETK